MAAEVSTTVATQWESGRSGSNNNQCGISFILTPEAVRYASLGEKVLPAEGTVVTLTSIEIGNGQAQGATLRPQSNLLPIITDADGYLVAFGTSTGQTVQRQNGSYYGGNWDYTRDFTTWSSFLAPTLSSSTISLEVGEQYMLFLMDGTQSGELLQAVMGSYGQPFLVTSNYYKDTVRYFSGGSYDQESTAQYGFINADRTAASLDQAPIMAVTVAYSEVPEPTTGTLSLLALAGLCIRRRK